jgi:hypothetical protein
MNTTTVRKRYIDELCIGHCAHCAEDVIGKFYNDGTVRVECAHSSICAKRRRQGAIDVDTSVGFDDEDLVWLRVAWPDIDWTQQGLHTFRLESAFDMAKAPAPRFRKTW